MAIATSAVIGATAAVAGVGLGIKSNMDANKAAKRARADAKELQMMAMEEFDELEKEIPSVEDRLYKLERLKSVGNLTPELEEAIAQEESELKNIQLDPKYKEMQMAALAKYEEIANEGGLTPQDRAKLEKIKSELNAVEKANREAILQAAAQRGTLSGGNVLTSQLLASQGAAQKGSQMGFDVAAEAYKRGIEAIEKGGQLAGQVRGQEYGEQRDAASAQDAINRFNVQQRTDVQRANIDRKNQAQQINLGNQQRIADANVGLSNEEIRNKVRAKEATFEDMLRVKAGKSGQLAGFQGNAAAQSAAAAQNAAAQNAAVTGGLMKVGGSLVDYGLKNWETPQPAATSTELTGSFTTEGYRPQGSSGYIPE